jgi:hypothetical protein
LLLSVPILIAPVTSSISCGLLLPTPMPCWAYDMVESEIKRAARDISLQFMTEWLDAIS